jgi:hypothetical protein
MGCPNSFIGFFVVTSAENLLKKHAPGTGISVFMGS